MSLDTCIADDLRKLLAEHDVGIEHPRNQMVEFRAVPLGNGFSKPRANVMLLKKDNWRLFVDEDLTSDQDHTRFGRLLPGPSHNQWQPLNPAQQVVGDVNEALLTALDLLNSPLCQTAGALVRPIAQQGDGVDETDFDLRPSWHGELLDMRRFVGSSFELTRSQQKALGLIFAAGMRIESPICPVLVGPSGSGKSVVAGLAAQKLVHRGVVGDVFTISGASLHAGVTYEAERDERLTEALSFVQSGTKPLVIFEHVDMLIASTRLVRALMAEIIDRGIRLIGIAQPEFDHRRLRKSGALPRRMQMIPVDGADPAEMLGLLARRLENWPLANGFELMPEAVSAAIALSRRESATEPAATIGLLETVLIDAQERDLKIIGPDEVYHVFNQSDE